MCFVSVTDFSRPALRLGLLFFMSSCFFLPARAQDKHIKVELKKRETVRNYIFLGEEGFVLSTTRLETGIYMPHTIFYFSPSLELLWKKEFKDKQQYAGRQKHLVASPKGSYTYYLEIAGSAGNMFNRKNHDVLQIKKDGTDKQFEIESSDAFGQSLQTIFCDEQYLYYLATENGDERHDKKKTKEKLILNRFAHESLRHERFVLDLPPIADGDNTTFWQYVANTETEIMLVSKAMDIPFGKAIYDVATISPEGKVASVKKIPVNLQQKFTRPADYVAPPGSRYSMATDLCSSTTTHNLNGSSQTITVVNSGGYGNLTYDPVSESFYVYGLLGPIPFRKISPLYEGFYVIHLDKDGNEQWRLQHTGPKELTDNDYFRKHGRPIERWITFSFLPNGHLNFATGVKQSVYEYDINSEGQLAGHKAWSKVGYESRIGDFPFSASGEFKSYDFIHKLIREKKTSKGHLSTVSSSSEVVIEHNERLDALNLYYFKRSR